MYDIIIVGGGIVGLATALKLSQKQPELKILLIEKEEDISAHQTGNNSGVIHSGIYYKSGSLKAVNCRNGYKQLLEFCDKEGLEYELCGKVIVATNKEQIPALDTLFKRGNENGLQGIKMLEEEEIKEIEPHVRGIKGIKVPETGIIDFKKVSEKYAEVISKNGGAIKTGEKVLKIISSQNHSVVQTSKGEYQTKLLINCAGLYSDKMAKLTEKKLDVKIIPFRGEYYKIAKKKQYLVKNLIYPVPDPAFPFLGVHFTRMIEGGIEAGPNAVFAFAREGYKMSTINVSETIESLMWPGFQKVMAKYWKTGLGEFYRSFSKKAFTRALQQLVPEITESDLTEGGAGVRAQACDRKGGLLDDFMIIENEQAINVCNAPSPAATSSLAIGDTVSALALKRFDK